MLTYAQALELAENWVRIVTQDEAVIVKEHTIKRPYGWVFFYQSRRYLASGQTRDRLAGNAPILVERANCEVRVTGTARSLEHYLAAYEVTIPAARMQMALPNEP
jgi:Immunity protein 35